MKYNTTMGMRIVPPLLALAVAVAALGSAMPAKADDGNDIVTFGNSVTIREGQEVSGDVVVFGGDAKIYGHVDGDVAVMGGDLYIYPSGEVDGSTVAMGGSVTNESTHSGSQKHGGGPAPIVTPLPVETPEVYGPVTGAEVDHSRGSAWITLLVVLGVLSLLAFALAPGAVRTVRDEFLNRPLIGTVVGFSWPFIFAVIMIALAITVIGIVIMPAVVVAVAVAYLVGRAAVAQLLGRRLFEVANVVEPAPLATVALGLVIITVIEGVLPLWMGIVLEACVSAIAIGAASLPLLRSRNLATVTPPGYVAPPRPVFTPPSPPPPSGPPAVPQ